MAKSKNIIQQLKDNEKPFGLMSEEMQEKANEIGCTEFDYYGTCVWESYLAGDFYNDQACRLRSDYAEEPEIEAKDDYLVLPAILSKLEEIRCGLIDVETAIEKNKN